MNAVTCQVSAYRESFSGAARRAGPAAAPDPRDCGCRAAGSGRVRYFSCGSQATPAASAGSAHTDRDSGTEPPDRLYTGIAISEARIDPAFRHSR